MQQAADGHNAAAMQRLVTLDLRHTAASPGPLGAARAPVCGPVARCLLLPIYGNGGGPVLGVAVQLLLCM